MFQLPCIDLPLKPNYQKITEDIDFFELFLKIEKKFDTCYLMESLGEESSERYSVLGFDPEMIISAKGKQLSIQKKIQVNKNNTQKKYSQTQIKSQQESKNLQNTKQNQVFETQTFSLDNPYYALRKIVPTNILSRNYAGGLVGYLSYEAVNYFEPILNLPEHEDFETFKFGVYLDGLVCDKMTGEIFYFWYTQDRSQLIQKLVKEDLGKNTEPQVSRQVSVKFLGNSLGKNGYFEVVKNTIEEIKAGNSFQAEAGFRSDFEIKGNPTLIYSELRKANPSPFMFYAKFNNQVLLGASPELLFRLKEGFMQSSPLAGTIHRGKTEEEDIILARELLNNPKEIAEHNMLVDMHRNDIGKVAKFGTVRVAKLMEIKKFSTVQHISSDIIGILKEGEDMFSALASNFPMGTLSGAPKIESIKIISRNEKVPRGPYGGGFGQFGFNGDCNFCGILRSLYIFDQKAYVQTSAGIVYDSKPEKEYQEIENKLAAMKKVLEKFKNYS